MYLIVGELLSQKNWLETQRFPAMTDSRFTSLVARDADRSPTWKYEALLPSFPSPELQDSTVGPHPFALGKMYAN